MQQVQNDAVEPVAANDAAPGVPASAFAAQAESRPAAAAAAAVTAEPGPKAQEDEAQAKKKKKKNKLGLKIEHQTAGRVRMKLHGAKGNPELLAEIGKTFGVIPGVERVTVNPTTGSLVLHYDHTRHDDFHRHLTSHCEEHHAFEKPPATQYDEIANKIEQEALFLAEHSHTAQVVVHVCRRLDREIKTRTRNVVDLKMGLAGGIVGLTLLELGATAATPVWMTLGVFMLNHLVELQQHHSLEKHQHDLEEKVNKTAPIVIKGEKSPPDA
jgi:hypothetical protein